MTIRTRERTPIISTPDTDHRGMPVLEHSVIGDTIDEEWKNINRTNEWPTLKEVRSEREPTAREKLVARAKKLGRGVLNYFRSPEQAPLASEKTVASPTTTKSDHDSHPPEVGYSYTEQVMSGRSLGTERPLEDYGPDEKTPQSYIDEIDASTSKGPTFAEQAESGTIESSPDHRQ